jgi:SpoVK/Ycf46/Vps4 family AAA+-type ATPase
MLANTVATKLEKKSLLVNFPTFGVNSSGASLKFLFREARINRAVLFFDERESLFLDREKGGSSVNMLLTELERFDGLCILVTNRAHDLDEAMHRRISLAIEFRKPDHIMQEEVWKTFQPPKVALEDDIDFGLIAKKYELPGGLIKNAWIQSLGLMVIRGRDKIRRTTSSRRLANR